MFKVIFNFVVDVNIKLTPTETDFNIADKRIEFVGLKVLQPLKTIQFDLNEIKQEIQEMFNNILNLKILGDKSKTFNKFDIIRK